MIELRLLYVSIAVLLLAILISVVIFRPSKPKYLVVGNSNTLKTRSVLKLMNLDLPTIKSSKVLCYNDFQIFCGSKRKQLEYQSVKGGKIIVLQKDEDFDLIRQVEQDVRPKLVVFDNEYIKRKCGLLQCKAVVQKLDEIDLNGLKSRF